MTLIRHELIWVQSRCMSDPTLSDIDFNNKMTWVWTTLKNVVSQRKKNQKKSRMSNQIACRITKVRQLTKTIRQVMLEPQTTNLNQPSFKPGQWVDFFPKNFENPGGFSISSAPDDLPNIELAIRSSPHPVVKWVFSDNCKENEIIKELIFPTIS